MLQHTAACLGKDMGKPAGFGVQPIPVPVGTGTDLYRYMYRSQWVSAG